MCAISAVKFFFEVPYFVSPPFPIIFLASQLLMYDEF